MLVGFRDAAGRQQDLVADFGVCTLPFPVLRRLDLAGLADPKRRAVEEYGLAGAARVYFQTDRAFWRDDALGRLGGLKMIGTDTPRRARLEHHGRPAWIFHGVDGRPS